MSRQYFSTYQQRVTFVTIVQVTNDLAMELENFDDSSISSDSDEEDDIADLIEEGIAIGAVLLAEINQPIENHNIVWGRRVTIADWCDAECLHYTRFKKADLQHIANQLWPRIKPFLGGAGARRGRIILRNRYTAPYETLLIIYLFRLRRPSIYWQEMEAVFGMRLGHLSRAIERFSAALYQVAHHYLCRAPSIWHDRMPYYASKIRKKCRVLNHVWGFIDGTFRRICRPKHHQQQCYSGYKHTHGLKFQAVVTPDGYIACLYGPCPGHRHDSTMLAESNLIDQLRQLMPENGANGQVYSMYGDAAYPQSRYLIGGFRNPPRNSRRAAFNQHMSKGRISVEWGFGLVTKYWAHIDHVPANRIYLSPYARHYINACFLTNLHNCTNMNEIAASFQCHPLSVEDYLSSVD